MNRPVLRAVVVLVLGEVTGLCATNNRWKGIALAMLFCVFLELLEKKINSSNSAVLGEKKKSMRRIAISLLLFSFGFWRANIVYTVPDITNQKISGIGIMTDILKSEESNTVVLKVDKYKMLCYEAPVNYEIGDYLQFQGEVKEFKTATNPGEFDLQKYYKSQGIDGYLQGEFFSVSKNEAEKVIPGTNKNLYYSFKQMMWEVRQRMSGKLSSITKDYTSLYKSILLGEKETSTEKKLFQMIGIAHILAISGLHISLLGFGLFRILRKCGLGFAGASFVTVAFSVSYGFVTGFSMSTVRAIIMLVLVLIGQVTGRRYDLPTGWAMALVLIALLEPRRLLNTSLVLSFAAMAGVMAGQYILKEMNRNVNVKRFRKRHRKWYGIFSTVLMSIWMQLITVPVTVLFYYGICPYSIFINLIVIPLVPIIIVSGVLGIIGSILSLELGSILIYLGEKVFWFYEVIGKFVTKLPFWWINIGRLTWIEVFIYYLWIMTILILLHHKVRRKLRVFIYKKTNAFLQRQQFWKRFSVAIFVWTALSFCILFILHRDLYKEKIVFLDVGQGDGIIICAENGDTLVIDGGSTSNNRLGDYVLEPALKYLGRNTVDYWFVTHTDEDHISGLVYILENYALAGIKINNICFSYKIKEDEEFLYINELAKKNDIEIRLIQAGDKLFCDADNGYGLTCLHPDASYVSDDKNSNSLGLFYESENISALFLGDMDEEAIRYMMKWYGDIRDDMEINLDTDEMVTFDVDIIKVPHHGSRYSLVPELYQHIETAIISCGENNRYGHPHQEVLECLDENEVKILVTEKEGAIIIDAH